MNPATELVSKCETQMRTALQGFLEVYTALAAATLPNRDTSPFPITPSYDWNKESYKEVIRAIGMYFYNVYNANDWHNTGILIRGGPGKESIIDLSIFKGTQHERRVGEFLQSLEQAFYHDSEADIMAFIKTLPEENRNLCTEYYVLMKRYGNDMKFCAFNEDLEEHAFHEKMVQMESFIKYNTFITKNVAVSRAKVEAIEQLMTGIGQILTSPQKREVKF